MDGFLSPQNKEYKTYKPFVTKDFSLNLSPIPQVDGCDPPAITPNTTQTMQPLLTSLPSVRRRTVEYTLDRNKQIKKLKKDANIEDFNVVVSKSMENVNIDCNTGFLHSGVCPQAR